MGEAVSKVMVPGANITAIMASMESKYRMVLAAFDNNDEFRQLFWARLGYTPANATRAAGLQVAAGSSTWRQQYTIGMLAAGLLLQKAMGVAICQAGTGVVNIRLTS
jgi:hypothetical protein